VEIVFFIVGAIFFVVGGLIVWDFRSFKQAAYPSQGHIVAYAVRQSRSKNGQSETYAPVVQYVVGGQSHQFTASIASSQVKHHIGDTVPILIHKTDPTRARWDTPLHNILGGIFLVLGLGAMVAFFFVFQFDVISLVIAAIVIGTLLFKAVSLLNRHNIRSMDDIKTKFSEIKQTGITTSPKDETVISDPGAFKRHVMRKQTAPVWLMLIFLVVGLCLVAGSAYLGVQRAEFIQSASVGYGTVVGFNSKTSSSDSGTTTTYYPLVEYTPPSMQERTIRFEHDVGSSHPGYRRGDEVKVLYSANNPKQAIIDQGWMNYFGPLLMLAIGSIFALVGVAVIIKQRKQKADQAQLKLDF
jgi:hypothetical protein